MKTIVIIGPTASGKSDLAIALAKQYDGEIISADSRQVYKGMDIGTGKVLRDALPHQSKNSRKYFSEGIVHYLIDRASPKRTYNVTQFIRDARKALLNIQKRKKLPIICGGTGFFIQSLIEENTFPSVKPDLSLRKKLETFSTEELFSLLKEKDVDRAKTIDRHNKIRLIRALEIIQYLGKVPKRESSNASLYTKKYLSHFILIALCPKKELLFQNIEKRLEKRLKEGMIAEVQQLHKEGVSFKRLESFGLEYRYIALFLQKKISLSEMKERLNIEIKHYAKRQITWIKRWEKMGATIHYITSAKEVTKIINKDILNKTS